MIAKQHTTPCGNNAHIYKGSLGKTFSPVLSSHSPRCLLSYLTSSSIMERRYQLLAWGKSTSGVHSNRRVMNFAQVLDGSCWWRPARI